MTPRRRLRQPLVATTTTPPAQMHSVRLPAFFATTTPASPRRVWLFDAIPVTDADYRRRHEDYRVRPSARFARWTDEHPGFLMEDDDRSDWNDHTTFIVDRPPRHGADIYHGGYMLPAADDWDRTRDVPMRWRYAGATIYSMLCPDPIPLIIVDRPEVLPMVTMNELRTTQGSRTIYRVWRQRWDPVVIAHEIDHLQEAIDERRRRVRTPSPDRPATVAVRSASDEVARPNGQSLQPLPKFVADALIRDAVAANANCPITMEPITTDTAAVTSCFHVFDANAIAIWLADHRTCPTCKVPTTTSAASASAAT